MTAKLDFYRESKKLCRCKNPWKRHFGFRWKDGPFTGEHNVHWPVKRDNKLRG